MDLPAPVEALSERWRRFAETVSRPGSCQFCAASRIRWNGWRKRTASVLHAGQVYFLPDIRCRRVDCAACGQSWTLRPPDLLPRRHHQLPVVASAASSYLFDVRSSREQVASRHSASRRTLGRWLDWLTRLAEPPDLQRHVLAASEAAALPRFREVKPSRPLLERAAQVLTLLEQLASAWRLAPPGLASVLQWVTRGREDRATYSTPLVPEFAQRLLPGPPATFRG